MNKHRFLIYSYIACAAMAIGSVGPWASGYLGFAGISGFFGRLSLLGAIVTALAIWRWGILHKPAFLIAAQVVGSFCIAAIIYTFYSDLYHPYVNAGDTWLDYIGWGLVLTLAGSVSLVVLCAIQYQRGGGPGNNTALSQPQRLVLLGSLAIPIVAMGFWTFFAIMSEDSITPTFAFPGNTRGPIPDYALKIAGGNSDTAMWDVWLFGNPHRDTCVGTRAVKDRSPREEGAVGDLEEAYCGWDVPPRYWQQMVEAPLKSKEKHKSAVFFLIRRDVGRLNVLTEQRDRERGQTLISTRAQARVITKRQARKVKLRLNIGYAVVVVPGAACVRRVEVFDWTGQRVEKTPLLPCEVEQ